MENVGVNMERWKTHGSAFDRGFEDQELGAEVNEIRQAGRKGGQLQPHHSKGTTLHLDSESPGRLAAGECGLD